MRIQAGGSARAWVNYQVNGLFEASALSTSPDEFIENWQYLQRVLGEESFTRQTRSVFDEPVASEDY